MPISPPQGPRIISKARHRERGFTLIEVLVVMAIIAVVVGAAAASLRSLLNVNLKQASGHLASTLRYLSNKAVTEHRYYRIIYHLDSQEYSVEESEKPFLIDAEESPEELKDESKEEAKLEEDKEKVAEKPEYTEATSKLLKRTKLPSGVYFKDVFVVYRKEKIERGKAYSYFFPDGFSTPTLINLRNEKDTGYFSVELAAMTGRVKVEGHYREPKE